MFYQYNFSKKKLQQQYGLKKEFYVKKRILYRRLNENK